MNIEQRIAGLRYKLPQPCGESQEVIEALATEMGKRLPPGASLLPCVSKAQGYIKYESAPMEELLGRPIGSTVANGVFTIYLSTTASRPRDRLATAQEIAHKILHYPLLRREDPNAHMLTLSGLPLENAAARRAFTEAQWFIAALLLPLDKVQAAHSAGKDAEAIAAKFCVPEALAERVCASLGRQPEVELAPPELS